MHQITQLAAGDHAMYVAQLLALGQVDEPAVAFVLNAVVVEQKSFGRIAQQGLNQFGQLVDGQNARAQEAIYLVVANSRQMAAKCVQV
ncbi:MAG: hypothetical protein ACRYFZ_10635 [Janthinobacterium lividum]